MDKHGKCNPNEETGAALAEARFLELMREDRDFAVKEEVKPVKEPKVDLSQVVEACMKQLQALQVSKKQSERPGSSQRKLRCWCCGEEGHAMRTCPVTQQIKTAYKQKDDKKIVSNGARGCQRFPESCPRVPKCASGYQMVPESAKGCHRVPDGAGGYQMVPE